ncbi:hypothetical protein [Aeromicrobium sp.]|uniref:hypothetical protein n=1 Tax=Aeromicrobium sp. TaxID=1871063 RepID=UPI0040337766
MSVAVGFVLGLVSGVALAFLLTFLEPVQRRLQQKGRAAFKEDPVYVHVETDRAVIWAGLPPWISGRYFFDKALPDDDPPDACAHWSAWSQERDGRPCGEFELLVTIQAKLDAVVVVNTPIVRIVESREVDGVTATCLAAGGASMNPRRFEIDLDGSDPPMVEYTDGGPGASGPVGFSLATGDVEQFHLWVRAEGRFEHTWSLELPMIVNGRDVRMDLGTFVMVGSGAAASEHLWQGEWQPYETPTYE